jgi:hypothetical protein
MYKGIQIWPDNLIEELAYRRCILFLGSGISATSTNGEGKSPSTWEVFLKNIKALMRNASPEDEEFVKNMLLQKNYLLALQAIYDLSDPGAYSKYLRDNYSTPKYSASDVHSAIKDLDSKIVITTNFDKIYDNLCSEDGYAIFTYKETKSIISNIKSPENVIIKAHGSIDDTQNIIFTSKQYHEAQATYPEFYSLLSSLFMTHTVIFLGYSLNDPDINLMLENISNTTNSNCPHYIVILEGMAKQLLKHWKETYNISAIEYGSEYNDINRGITDLRDLVLAFRESVGIP